MRFLISNLLSTIWTSGGLCWELLLYGFVFYISNHVCSDPFDSWPSQFSSLKEYNSYGMDKIRRDIQLDWILICKSDGLVLLLGCDWFQRSAQHRVRRMEICCTHQCTFHINLHAVVDAPSSKAFRLHRKIGIRASSALLVKMMYCITVYVDVHYSAFNGWSVQ